MVFAVKLYPAGATTNSHAGVTDLFANCMPVLEEMAEQGFPLLVSNPLEVLLSFISRSKILDANSLPPGAWRSSRSKRRHI